MSFGFHKWGAAACAMLYSDGDGYTRYRYAQRISSVADTGDDDDDDNNAYALTDGFVLHATHTWAYAVRQIVSRTTNM